MKRFKNILCVIEPDKIFKPTLERAITLAENNQATLTVVAVIDRLYTGVGMPEGSPITKDLQASIMSEHEQRLEKLVEAYRKRYPINTRILAGTPFLEIIREVIINQHDLVIKTPENRSWLDRLFGSDDMHLLRKCPCAVWLIKADIEKSYRRILVAIDIDEAYPEDELESHSVLNRQILEMASSLALSDFAELHIGHAWEAVGENAMRSPFVNITETQINDYVEQVRQQHEDSLDALVHEVMGNQGSMNYLKPHMHLVKGWARKEIPALARQIDADLIIMGTVARIGIPGFIIGNTAETILNQIDCSVLAIKPPGFKTPVILDD